MILAEALTKPVERGDLAIHETGINLETRSERHHEAPQMVGEECVHEITWAEEEEDVTQ